MPFFLPSVIRSPVRMEKQSLQTLFILLPSYSSGTLLSEHFQHTTCEGQRRNALRLPFTESTIAILRLFLVLLLLVLFEVFIVLIKETETETVDLCNMSLLEIFSVLLVCKSCKLHFRLPFESVMLLLALSGVCLSLFVIY